MLFKQSGSVKSKHILAFSRFVFRSNQNLLDFPEQVPPHLRAHSMSHATPKVSRNSSIIFMAESLYFRQIAMALSTFSLGTSPWSS